MTAFKHCKFFIKIEKRHPKAPTHRVLAPCGPDDLCPAPPTHTCLHTRICCLFSTSPTYCSTGTSTGEAPACRVLRLPREEILPQAWSLRPALGPCGTVTTAAGGSRLPGSTWLGLGDHLAGPTHFLPLDGFQRNHRTGLGRQGAPVCLQPTQCPTVTAPLGGPHPFSSTCSDWTPRASPGLTQTMGATMERPSLCLSRAGLHHPASCRNVYVEPASIKH